jgi:hypothetical protein
MRVVLHVPVVSLYFCLPIRVFVQPPTSFDLISLFDVKSPFNLKLHSISNFIWSKTSFEQKHSIKNFRSRPKQNPRRNEIGTSDDLKLKLFVRKPAKEIRTNVGTFSYNLQLALHRSFIASTFVQLWLKNKNLYFLTRINSVQCDICKFVPKKAI